MEADQQPQASHQNAQILRCGDIQVRPATRELLLDGTSVALERRAFDVLVYLMSHPDRVVDKDELWREVWASRPISESTVPQAVSRARKALGHDNPEHFIATVYGVGYRFSQVVEQESPGDKASAGSTPGLTWLALSLAMVALALTLWQLWPEPEAPSDVRVAILPVQNETGNAELDWVSYGVLPLLDQTLSDAGVNRVSSGTVLATLRRYPDETEPQGQAQVLRLSTGAQRVLVPRLTEDQNGYHLSLSDLDNPDDPLSLHLQGEDISMLAVAVADSLSQSLSRWQGSERARRHLVTDDPFLNEAFARGLDARLRGRYEEAARYFDTVLAAAPDLHHARYHLSIVTRRLGDWDYTDELNQELLAAARADGDQSMLAAVQSVSGVLAWRRGDKAAAEDWYRKSLANYQALNNLDYVASVNANLGILASTRGQFGQAEQLFLKALAHYQQSGDRFNEATTLKNLGNLYNDQGEFDTAEGYLEQALAIRQELRLPLQVAMTLSNLADIKMARGHWQDALAYHQRVLSNAQEFDDPVLETQARADLAASLRRLGRLTESAEMAAQALTIATERDHRTNQAFAILQQGRTQYALGYWQRAAELLADAERIFASIEEPLGQVNSKIALAEALIQMGKLDEAKAALDESGTLIESFELDRMLPALGRAQARLADHLDDGPAALQAIADAYEAANAGQAPIEALDTGGEFGRLLLQWAPDDNRLADLAAELAPRAEISTSALAFLSNYLADRDPSAALQLAERRRALLGEGWTPEDEQFLESLGERLSEDSP